MSQTRKKNRSNNSTPNAIQPKNSKRYETLSNTRKNKNNRHTLNKNKGNLETNLVKLSNSVASSQLRLTNTIKKEGSKLSRKIMDNPILMNTVKSLFFKQVNAVPGVGSVLNKANTTKNFIKNRINTINK